MKLFKNHKHEKEPWGGTETLILNEVATVKLIFVKPNEALSLQQHEHRDEEWKIIKGHGVVTVGDKKTEVKQDDEFFVARHTKHRVEAGPDGLEFLEISLGDFDENDIERFDDRYGRA